MRLYCVVPVCLFFIALTSFAQTPEELSVLPSKLGEGPSVAPTECPAVLLVVAQQTSGSDSYVRLKRLLSVMELGHYVGWTPWLRQPNKTLFVVRCKWLDRQDHCTAF